MKDLEKYNNKIYSELREELELYAEMGIVPVRKLNGALQSIREAILKMKNFILERPFADGAAEILFFKTMKPGYVSEQIYLVEMTLLQMSRPSPVDPGILEFYVGELKKLRLFFDHHRYFYQYYLMGAAELDSRLFVRGADPMDTLLTEIPDTDPVFSTNGDFLWAKFMALERLRDWLEDEIEGVRGGRSDGANGGPGDGVPVLKWTGETINLVEIAYGIWLTGQVNNGNVSVSEIVQWLERHFAVRIGKAHRRWQNIAGRKRLAPFRYIDEVKNALVKRLEDEWGK
jgi:hypothetical protein